MYCPRYLRPRAERDLRRFLLLFLLLFAIAGLATAEDVWTGVDRIVAIGDVHGDYDQFFTLLQQTGLVNDRGRWTGGRAHLVQIGDIPDRGPDTRRIMDLLMRLERQAAQAGGRVHALIGNHDAMNIYGDLRYTTPEEFAAFRTSDSERVRDAFWQQHVDEMKSNSSQAEPVEIDEAQRNKWYEEHPLGWFEHRFAYGPRGEYRGWVEEHNAVIKINDTLFVHGGISPSLATASIRDINERVRAELQDLSLIEGGMVIATDGPLWYRGLAVGDEEELSEHVTAVLDFHEVSRIVIGHTPTEGTVIPRFGGSVVNIDVGLSAAYGARLACLVIEKGTPYAIHRGVKLPLPAGSEEELLEYFTTAAKLDPAPSPLNSLIEQLAGPAAAVAGP